MAYWRKDLFLSEAECHLSDVATYVDVDQNPIKENQIHI